MHKQKVTLITISVKNVLITVSSIAVVVAVIYAFYIYNKPHIDVENQKADFDIGADIILNDFTSDPVTAAQKYNGKIIIVDGLLNSEVSKDPGDRSILISSADVMINCELDSTQLPELQGYTKGEPVTVKGIFIGFDDLLEELQMNNCFIGKNEEF